MQCNSCWSQLEPDVKSCVLPCLHIYCRECAQKQLDADSCCMQCGAMFSAQTVKGVSVMQDASKLALVLCGQAPDVVMQAALTAVHCYIKQAELAGQLREAKLQRRMEALRSQCNDKLQQVHGAYTKAKARADALAAQAQEAAAEREELHSKYQQKNNQFKHLKAQLDALQQQGQQQQHLGGIGGRAPRAMSPSTSGPHHGMVHTTVQRSTQFFNLGDGRGGPGGVEPLGQPGPTHAQRMYGGGGGCAPRRGGAVLGGSAAGGSAESPSLLLGGHGGGNGRRLSHSAEGLGMQLVVPGGQHQLGGHGGGMPGMRGISDGGGGLALGLGGGAAGGLQRGRGGRPDPPGFFGSPGANMMFG